MERTLLFIACVLASLTMSAQGGETGNDAYLPFVELGKQLHVVIVKEPNYSHTTGKYWMCEEMERDGKKYIYTYLPYDETTNVEEVGLLREENRRVYKYDEAAGRDIMLYDFSLKEGDIFTYEYGFDQPVNCKVLKQGWLDNGPKIVLSRTLVSADSLDVKYRWLRTWTIGRDNGSGEYDEVTTWVEGIGALENMFSSFASDGAKVYLSYVERDCWENEYLPFSFCNIFDMFGQIHGCNLPTGEKDYSEDWRHQLNYELEGDCLHVYGKVFTQCGPNNYAYFLEKPTDDPLVHKIEFEIQEVEPLANCMALHATNFYVPGFNPNMSYIVVDDQGAEHPVINKTPQMAYRPFVEEGKVWKVGAVNSGNPVQWVEYYYFDGDTIIDGRTCKRMMRQIYVSPDYPYYELVETPSFPLYEGAWYEEDKKVYFYDATTKQLGINCEMMYDFSANTHDTIQINNQRYIIGPRQTGGINGFKGVYREVANHMAWKTTWLEGVGSLGSPRTNIYEQGDPAWFLMSCTVGDEVIYFNDEFEDGATPEGANARKRFDFTHTIKIQPTSRMKSGDNLSLYGEYNDLQLGINLYPLDDAYLVRIINETGKVVYEKAIDASYILGLNIDISNYAAGHYTVTVENSRESFTGEFKAQATGIEEIDLVRAGTGTYPYTGEEAIYNLQGQRISYLQKGLNIVNGQKLYVK